MSTVLQIENISKQYRLGVISRKMLVDDLRRKWALWRNKPDPTAKLDEREDRRNRDDLIWALRDVSFSIQDGDVVGIIGRNGSGKSTLLKIISEITSPTMGTVAIKGRVASLLEVGTGFHPELTGRDNVYLNGSILGMNPQEIRKNFDAIVDFSGVEKFIDTPVKRYSSGMKVRLAFAVAAHLEPEILVIDEVLAVGDAEFQKKCLNKVGEVARTGRTVLFVSHNAAAVENLCQKGIVLHQGNLMFQGTQTEALEFYSSQLSTYEGSLRERKDRLGTGRLRIVKIDLKDVNGRPLSNVTSGQDFDIFLHFENYCGESFPYLIAGVTLKTIYETPVFIQNNRLTGQLFGPLPPKGAFVCRIRRLPVPPSSYKLGFIIVTQSRGAELLDLLPMAIDLSVEAADFFGTGELPSPHDAVALVEGEWRLASTDD